MADGCGWMWQAYQVLKRGGLDDDHIVVMMADDLANNIMNPHPGKLFNRPYGPDVYDGVPLVRWSLGSLHLLLATSAMSDS